MVRTIKNILTVLIIFCVGSCSRSACDGSYNWTNGWNYWKGVTLENGEAGYSNLFYVEDCWANGMSITFYPDSPQVIYCYGELQNGKQVGIWRYYDSIGGLKEVKNYNSQIDTAK